MGSHQDLQDATAFIAKHRIVPIVSHVLDGLESADAGFDLIKRGDQFGKVVIKLRASSVQAAKLWRAHGTQTSKDPLTRFHDKVAGSASESGTQ
jgi:hypothetical protein